MADIRANENLSDEEILARLEKKVAVGDIVQIRDKFYQRKRPQKNRLFTDLRKFIPMNLRPSNGIGIHIYRSKP